MKGKFFIAMVLCSLLIACTMQGSTWEREVVKAPGNPEELQTNLEDADGVAHLISALTWEGVEVKKVSLSEEGLTLETPINALTDKERALFVKEARRLQVLVKGLEEKEILFDTGHEVYPVGPFGDFYYKSPEELRGDPTAYKAFETTLQHLRVHGDTVELQ